MFNNYSYCLTINYIVFIISLILCRRRGIRRDTLIRRQRQHRRVASEILKRRHGLEYPLELAEGGGGQPAAYTSHRRRLLLTSPRGLAGGKCGLGLESEYDRLGHFLAPRASCEGVARAICQDGEVGGKVGGGRLRSSSDTALRTVKDLATTWPTKQRLFTSERSAGGGGRQRLVGRLELLCSFDVLCSPLSSSSASK